LEGTNPGGMKDRPALHMVDRARRRGELRPGATIIESTSGTLGLGLVLAGMIYRHPVTLVTDIGMEPMMRRLLTAYGARIELIDQPHPTGGWQEARRQRVQALREDDPTAYCPDQYHNPDNVDAYHGLALELTGQLGWVDVLVCSVGTGGHSAGINRTLRHFYPEMRLVGVDTIGSTIFGQPAGTRLMRGLGSSIYPRNVDYSAFDEVHWVAPGEAVWSSRRLAGEHHATGGWSVGAVALVADWIARTHPVGTRIAAVFPDGPHRYLETVFNDDYCLTHDLLDVVPAPEPIEVSDPLTTVVDRWSRTTKVFDPTTTPNLSGAAR
jgi:cysteine synthase A